MSVMVLIKNGLTTAGCKSVWGFNCLRRVLPRMTIFRQPFGSGVCFEYLVERINEIGIESEIALRQIGEGGIGLSVGQFN